MSKLPEPLHAFFSERMKAINGTFIYRNAQGEDLECTMVTKNKDGGPVFDDTVYLGEVVEYVKARPTGRMNGVDTTTPEGFQKLLDSIALEEKRDKDPYRWN